MSRTPWSRLQFKQNNHARLFFRSFRLCIPYLSLITPCNNDEPAQSNSAPMELGHPYANHPPTCPHRSVTLLTNDQIRITYSDPLDQFYVW